MRLLTLIALAAAVPALAFADLPPQVVHNGATPVHGVQTMQLQEMWRVGGAGDEENFFGLVTWAEEGPDGLIYVLDTQLCQVNVYDEGGRLVRTLFRQGEGPGEVQRPRDLVLLPDGTIGAVQEFPGRIIRVHPDGTPAESLTPRSGDATTGGFIAMSAAEHRGGTFLVAGVQIRPGPRDGTQERTMYLAGVGPDDQLTVRYVETSVVWDLGNFVYDEAVNLPQFFWAHAVGPDGRVYAAPDRDAYRIDVHAVDGTIERVIEREYAPWHRTAEDRKWLDALFAGAFRQIPFEYRLKICENEANIRWMTRPLQVSDAGELWVLPSRGTREQPPGVVATFDVFSPDGVFDRQVQVACEGDGEEDGVFLLGSDRVLLIKGYVDAMAAMFGGAVGSEEDEAEPMALVCYRIVE